MQHNRGIYFEKGTMEGCYILFQHNSRGFSIGTEECDGPDLILNSTEYVYLCISGSKLTEKNELFRKFAKDFVHNG